MDRERAAVRVERTAARYGRRDCDMIDGVLGKTGDDMW